MEILPPDDGAGEAHAHKNFHSRSKGFAPKGVRAVKGFS
jgi:hypothetical protein